MKFGRNWKIDGSLTINNLSAQFQFGDGTNSNSAMDVDAVSGVTSGSASLRLFKNTNTSGTRLFDIYRGDGSSNIQHHFNAYGDSYVNALTGNFGIGVSTPGYKLQVAGDIRMANNLYFTNPLQFLDGSSSTYGLTSDTSNGIRIFSGSASARMLLDTAGNVTIGSAAISTSATDGFLYLPSCAGTPSGTPTTKTGAAPVVIDSTNNKLYYYAGGWKTSYTPRVGVYRHFFVGAGAVCAGTSLDFGFGVDSTKIVARGIAFSHGVDASIDAQFVLPDVWDLSTTLKVKIYWVGDPSSSGTGNVRWGVAGRTYQDEELLTDALGTTVYTTKQKKGDNKLNVTSVVSITLPTAPLTGDLVNIRITRKGTDGADTLADVAYLLAFEVQYLESSTEPASW